MDFTYVSNTINYKNCLKQRYNKQNKLNLYVENAIKISIKDNTGIEDIKNRISEIFNLEKISTQDMTYLGNARSISLLKQALNKINECLKNIKENKTSNSKQ